MGESPDLELNNMDSAIDVQQKGGNESRDPFSKKERYMAGTSIMSQYAHSFAICNKLSRNI
jgi:hypothetical protein